MNTTVSHVNYNAQTCCDTSNIQSWVPVALRVTSKSCNMIWGHHGDMMVIGWGRLFHSDLLVNMFQRMTQSTISINPLNPGGVKFDLRLCTTTTPATALPERGVAKGVQT